MNATELKERYKGFFQVQINRVKVRIFGVNNEHLDFLMDTFNKLNPQQQNAALGGGVAAVILAMIFSFYFYYAQVNLLQSQLNNTFKELRDLKQLKAEEAAESQSFDKLVDNITRKTRDLNFKPFFEKVSRTLNIPINNIGERPVEIDSANPLSLVMKEVHLDMRLSKISIPKLLEFMIEVEKSDRYLRVQNLKITGIYGNKLYFDVDVLIRGYQTSK